MKRGWQRRILMGLTSAALGSVAAGNTCNEKLRNSFVGATQSVFTGLFDPRNPLFLFQDALDDVTQTIGGGGGV